MSEITVRPLSPELLPDYLYFFDNDAFADNSHWASCYCYFHQAPHHEKKWEDRGAAENRAGSSDLIRRSEIRGYLAYSGESVVGWCNTNKRTRYTTIGEEGMPMQEDIAAIVCFLVAKPFRGRGVARRLLAAALEGLERDGLKSVYTFTRTDTDDPAENCQGPLALYLDAGFEKIGERPGMALVRKNLGDSN